MQKYLTVSVCCLNVYSLLLGRKHREEERYLPPVAAPVHSPFKYGQTHAEPHRVAVFLNPRHLLSPRFISLSLNCLHALPFSSFCLIRFPPPWRTSSATEPLTSLPFAFFSPSPPLFVSLIIFHLFSLKPSPCEVNRVESIIFPSLMMRFVQGLQPLLHSYLGDLLYLDNRNL